MTTVHSILNASTIDAVIKQAQETLLSRGIDAPIGIVSEDGELVCVSIDVNDHQAETARRILGAADIVYGILQDASSCTGCTVPGCACGLIPATHVLAGDR